MKNRIKKHTINIAFSLVISLLFSCEDTMMNNMVDDKVYLLHQGLNEVDVINSQNPNIALEVIKSGVGQREVSLQLSINPSLLTSYNEANGTAYSLLDPTFYNLENATIEMNKDTYQLPFNISIDAEKLKSALIKDPDLKVAIPCEVTVLNPSDNDPVKMETIIIPKVIEPYIRFTIAGFLTEVNNILPSSADILSYYSKIEINYATKMDVEFSVGQAKDYQALIKQYNEEHNMNYSVLPETAYSLENTGKIPVGADYTSITIQVFKDKLVDEKQQPKFGEYLLPIEVNQVSVNKIDPDNNYILIPFSYHE